MTSWHAGVRKIIPQTMTRPIHVAKGARGGQTCVRRSLVVSVCRSTIQNKPKESALLGNRECPDETPCSPAKNEKTTLVQCATKLHQLFRIVQGRIGVWGSELFRRGFTDLNFTLKNMLLRVRHVPKSITGDEAL
jgi:hypothetical protein